MLGKQRTGEAVRRAKSNSIARFPDLIKDVGIFCTPIINDQAKNDSDDHWTIEHT